MNDEWQEYDGNYEKVEYDIKLTDGTVIENCWPNAGTFHVLDDTRRIINGDSVTHIRERELCG